MASRRHWQIGSLVNGAGLPHDTGHSSSAIVVFDKAHALASGGLKLPECVPPLWFGVGNGDCDRVLCGTETLALRCRLCEDAITRFV
jgi:hypothetical protein